MPTTLEIRNRFAAEADLFSMSFDDPAGRKWVVRKFLDHYRNESDPEAASRTSLLRVKAVADDLVNAQRTTHDADRAPPNYVRPGTDKDAVTRVLVRVIYAAFGVHPDVLIDTADNAELLKFIVNRRLRTIFRMLHYVNEYFDFPSKDVWHSSVRSLAKDYWKGVSDERVEEWPFALSELGKQDPVLAVNKLFDFQVPSGEEDYNFVECQTAAAMVLMDSLLEAADAFSLLGRLANQAIVGYLGVDFPDGAMRRYERLTPSGDPTGVFDTFGRLHVLQNDLLPGSDVIDIVPPEPVLVTPKVGEPSALTFLTREGLIWQTNFTEVTQPPQDRIVVTSSAGQLKSTTLSLSGAPSTDEIIKRGTRVMYPGTPLHFLSDTRPEHALFDQGFVPLEDIQPGDVFHVLGHPLVRDKIPGSPWGGERVVVVHPWTSRPYLMAVTGHGIGLMTILDLTSFMLQVANRLLTVSRRTLTRSLAASMVGTPVASGTIPIAAGSDEAAIKLQTWIKETIGRAKGHLASVWIKEDYFTGTWKVYNFPAIEASTLPWWDRWAEFGAYGVEFGADYPGQWVLEVDGTLRGNGGEAQYGATRARQLFIFDYWSTGDSPTDLQWPMTGRSPEHGNGNFVALESNPLLNPGGSDPKHHFAIPYFDDQRGASVLMPLFQRGAVSARADPTNLNYDDLLPQLFALAKDDTEAWVLRPRVSADADYFDYLRSIGAIPSSP